MLVIKVPTLLRYLTNTLRPNADQKIFEVIYADLLSETNTIKDEYKNVTFGATLVIKYKLLMNYLHIHNMCEHTFSIFTYSS